jgi:GABA permease
MSTNGDVAVDGVVLVVANRTLQGAAIEEALLRRARAGPVRFHLVVPATPLDDQLNDLLVAERLGSSSVEDGGFVIARRRLADAERRWKPLGLELTGEVGDPDPLRAVLAACRARVVAEVVVSTLPRGRSLWLRDGLPRKLRRHLDVPLEVVEAPRVRTRKLAAR